MEEVRFTITTYYQQLQMDAKEITPQLLKAMFLGEETDDCIFERVKSPDAKGNHRQRRGV